MSFVTAFFFSSFLFYLLFIIFFFLGGVAKSQFVILLNHVFDIIYIYIYTLTPASTFCDSNLDLFSHLPFWGFNIQNGEHFNGCFWFP